MGTPGTTRGDAVRTSTQDPAKYTRQAAQNAGIRAIIAAVNEPEAVKTTVHAANGTKTFALRPTADTLADLSRPIDPRHLKTRKQGTATLTYCPWNTIARHLHHRAPGWCWEVQSVQEVVDITTRASRTTRMHIVLLSVVLSQPKRRHRLVDFSKNLIDLLKS